MRVSINKGAASKAPVKPSRMRARIRSHNNVVEHTFDYRHPKGKKAALMLTPLEIEGTALAALDTMGLRCKSLKTRSIDSITADKVTLSIIGFNLTEDSIQKVMPAVDKVMFKSGWSVCYAKLVPAHGTAMRLILTLDRGDVAEYTREFRHK